MRDKIELEKTTKKGGGEGEKIRVRRVIKMSITKDDMK